MKKLMCLSLGAMLVCACQSPAQQDEAKKDKAPVAGKTQDAKVAEVAPNQIQDVVVVMKTTKGDIKLKLFATKAPVTVANFLNLAAKRYYEGVMFHRVIPNFMVQGGDPTATGSGGPGYNFEDEFVAELKHDKPGILSMANSGPASNGSQFFITHVPTPWLDGKHSVFGEVVGSMDVVNKIQRGDKIISIAVEEGNPAPLLKKYAQRVAQWDSVLGTNR